MFDYLVSEVLYLVDSDGNGIEIYWDCLLSIWEWNDSEVVMVIKFLDVEVILVEGNGKLWIGLFLVILMGYIYFYVFELE